MKRAKAMLFGAGVVTIAGLGVSWELGKLPPHSVAQPSPATGAPVPVVTARAQRGDVAEYIQGIGAVQAYNTVVIRSRADGALMQVPLKEGQEVKEGDLVAVIDPRPYQAALDQAKAKLAQDEASLANAKLDLARFSSLARSDFASRQQLDTQQATVAQNTAAVQGDQAGVEAAQLNLSYCAIRAPISGKVGLRLLDPGNLVHATDATGIITIAQDHPITAVFTLPEDNLPAISAALANGAAPVAAFSSDGATQLDAGTLLAPNNQVDASTGTIQLKAEFPNRKNILWPGQFINARLQTGVARNAVTIPAAAIQRGPDGLYVFVIAADIAHMRPISIGYQNTEVAVITKGVSGGETVVVSGASRLDSGTQVAATPATPQTSLAAR